MSPADKFELNREKIVAIAMRTLMPCIGALLLMGGLLSITSFALMPLAEYLTTQQWVETEAKVEQLQLRDHGRGLSIFFPSVDLRYRYQVDGQAYTGDRFGLHSGVVADGDRLRAFARSAQPGSTIKVWVAESDPARSLVTRALDMRLVAIAVPGFLLCILGVVMVIGGMVSWNRTSTGAPIIPPD